MKKMIKKLCVCMMAAILGLMPGIVTDTNAATYEWTDASGWESYYYNTPDDARNYNIEYENDIAVAVGGYINLNLENNYYDNNYDEVRYEWSISNDKIKMDISSDQKSAKITGCTKGNAEVTCSVIYKNADDEEFQTESVTANVQITNPKLKSNKIGLVVGQEGSVEITGNASVQTDRILYAADNTGNFVIHGKIFYGFGKQTRKVYVYVDGIILTATVKCTDPKLSRTQEILKKGQSASYELKGTSGYTPVTYKIKNTKYATVSKAGKVKAKNYGKTTLTAKADGDTWQFTLYIVKSKTYTAVMKAHSICKSKPVYSQSKRMKNGYVDCSSFIWKSYKPAKVYFGSKTYAPTAADIAKWCSKNKKLLKLSTYNGKSDKLKPGDLIFYRKRSGKNGRYKNIDHVAMYVGNDTIVHADSKTVSYRNPWYRKVAAIARPVK